MLIYSSWVIQFKCIFIYYCTRFDKQCFVEICLHQEKLWITELNSGAFQFDLHFPAKELLEFAVHFHPTHPAIFLTFTPELSQNFSGLLNLDKKGSYWNCKSQKENEKRIILLPCKLDVSVASAIKEIFSLNRNVGFRELTVDSSPPSIINAGTSVWIGRDYSRGDTCRHAEDVTLL